MYSQKKKAGMEPMRDKESTPCNKAMEKIFDRLGIPETIYSDEGSEFTNNSFIQLLDKHKIEMIYATDLIKLIKAAQLIKSTTGQEPKNYYN
jgi:hypothetical protein